MADFTKFLRAELPLSADISIDCYMMPNGEKRIGITGAARSAGRSKEYLSRLQSKGSKQIEALQSLGFQGCQIEGHVVRDDGRGSPIAKTISVRDYTKYITWEAVANGKKEAIVILAALAETGLENALDLLFTGRSVEFLLEKIQHYSTWTNEDLREVLFYNRQEVASLKLGVR